MHFVVDPGSAARPAAAAAAENNIRRVEDRSPRRERGNGAEQWLSRILRS
jgi:hypothetical protein